MNRADRAARRRAAAWAPAWDTGIIAVVLMLLAAALALGGYGWRLDRVVYDLGLALWSRPPPPGIVIVAIDDASIQAIGRWPWRRAVHATLLDRLAAARPRAVVLDLLLSEPDPDPGQDLLLARAMARVAPVVLPVAWQGLGGSTLAAVEPVEPLRSQAALGAAEAAVDADGVLRSAFLRAGPAGTLYPHLALAALQAGGETPSPRVQAEPGPGDTAVLAPGAGQRQREGRLLIRYAGPPGTVERVSYVDVLSGAVPASRLAGRYVLIGATGAGVGDTLATPVNRRHHAMPGIEVHANLLYTLRSGDSLRTVEGVPLAAGAGLLLAALLAGFAAFGPRTALPLAVASAPLALGASLVALGLGWWASPVPFVLPALLAYPLWSWRRLERAVAGLDREIARLDADPPGGGVPQPAPPRGRGDAITSRLQSLQRAGALVRQARRFLADTLAAMPTAMLVADEQAHVVLANPRAAALFEVETAAEMQGLDLPRLLGEFATAQPFDWPAAIAGLDPAGEGLAVEARLPGGGDFVVHVAAVDLQGLRRLVVTIADIKPVKQAQQEREEVLAFVSHDLRSPASAIVLLADLQLQGRSQTPADELLRELRRLAARTLEMSEDFVRAAQVQTRALEPVPVRLQALVDEALADLRAQARVADVRLHTTLADADAAVTLDRALAARAIANLVSNAIKHSPRGGVVELEAAATAGALRLSVHDQGPGLTPRQLQQLAAGDQAVSVRDAGGVGLGLLFVQRVARRHGGHLHATTTAAGALFVLELPPPAGAGSGNP